MNTQEMPADYEDVMVTFKDRKGKQLTKRGFYDPNFKHFAIPPAYQRFNGVLLPHGWGGHRCRPGSIIKWEAIPEEST